MKKPNVANAWLKIQFDKICKNISERIDDPKQAGTNYYVGLEHLDSEDPKINRYGDPFTVCSSKFRFKSGQILFGRRRAYLRKLVIADRDGICSTDIFVLDAIEGSIIKDFLPLLMQTEEFFNIVLTHSAGSLSPRVKWSHLAKQEFWIPSKPEQEKIVKIMQGIDETISRIQELLDKLKIFKNSKTNDLLTSGITNTKFKIIETESEVFEIPEKWDLVELGKNCEVRKDIHDIDSGFYVGLEHIGQGTNTLIGRGDTKEFTSSKKIFRKGDVLYGKLRPLLNKVWLASDEGYCSTDILPIVTNENLNNQFLVEILSSKHFVNYAAASSSGTKMPRTNWSDIKKYKIGLPPLPEQEKIMLVLLKLDLVMERLSSHLSMLKTMRKSILNEKLTMKKLEETPLVQ